MTRDDIIKMAREAGAELNSDLPDWSFEDDQLESFAAIVAAAEREKVAAWMMRQGYATGHGDSIEKLLEELEWQIVEREREACANLLLNVDLSSMDADHRLQSWTATVLLNFSDAIRARGGK